MVKLYIFLFTLAPFPLGKEASSSSPSFFSGSPSCSSSSSLLAVSRQDVWECVRAFETMSRSTKHTHGHTRLTHTGCRSEKSKFFKESTKYQRGKSDLTLSSDTQKTRCVPKKACSERDKITRVTLEDVKNLFPVSCCSSWQLSSKLTSCHLWTDSLALWWSDGHAAHSGFYFIAFTLNILPLDNIIYILYLSIKCDYSS